MPPCSRARARHTLDSGPKSAVHILASRSKRVRGRGRSQREYGLAMASASDAASATVPHLSVAERVARGKAARAEVPRSSHATFEPAAHRPDPVEALQQQAQTRVPELVPIRYG